MQLEFDQVSFAYPRASPIFDRLQVTFRNGTTGLLGVNGAGKTTLLKLAIGILKPSYGTVRAVEGNDERGANELGSSVAYMPQAFVPPRGLTVTEFLAYIGWLRGVPRARRAARIGEVLEQVELAGHKNAEIATLSGGLVRRVLLAQAVLSRSPILLLDEPTAGLDPEQRVKVRSIISRLAEERSIVMSSHIMEDIEQVATRVVMLDEGIIRFDGLVTELRETGSRYAGSTAGLSAMEVAFMRLRDGGRQG